jgi:hypothetical protein
MPMNGTDGRERMHPTLKKEATKPSGKNILQQRAHFDAFVREFNRGRDCTETCKFSAARTEAALRRQSPKASGMPGTDPKADLRASAFSIEETALCPRQSRDVGYIEAGIRVTPSYGKEAM